VSILGLAWLLGRGRPLSAEEPGLQPLRACENKSNDAARLTYCALANGRIQPERNDDVDITGWLLRAKRRRAGMPETPARRMRAKGVAFIHSPTGTFTVTLDGQAWVQQALLEFPIEVGDEATVRPGLFGALCMITEHRNRRTRVFAFSGCEILV
jgi:hypothetical protein